MREHETTGRAVISANPEQWNQSQRYELEFWKERWCYRHMSVPELQRLRLDDAAWLLGNMGFARAAIDQWDGFAGSVLEVGCGPLGFFELVRGVEVTANDSLMSAYAREIPFATLGRRGSVTYVSEGVEAMTERFDFVVCSNVLDHTADWMEFLELLTTRLARGGHLLLATDARGVPNEGHTQVFTPSQLLRAIRWLGLSVMTEKVLKWDDGHCDYKVFIRAGARQEG